MCFILCDLVKEAYFSKEVLIFHVPDIETSTIAVPEDNEGTIRPPDKPLSLARSHQIDARHLFLNEKVIEGKIPISYVESERQHADLQTRPVTRKPSRCIELFLLNTSE